MKALFILLLFSMCLVRVYSQSTLPLRADTVVVEKIGGNANLKLKDASRDTIGGIYVNIGGGVLRALKTKRLNDTSYVIGMDTIRVGAGGSSVTLSNAGTGYRWVKTPNGQIKTVDGNNTIVWDSTTNSLSARVDTSYISTQSDLKDTAAALRSTINSLVIITTSNAGSGFRWVKTPAGAIKTAIGAYGVNIDSTSNTDALTFNADTSELITPSRLRDTAVALRAAMGGGGGGQTLQQVFNNGSVLTKHDTIFHANKMLVTNGQFINKDTNRANENQTAITLGVSIDRGLVTADTALRTDWVRQVTGALGLRNWNRASSGSAFISHAGPSDSSFQSKLPTIQNYEPSIRYIIIGNYTVNESQFGDTVAYRAALIAGIDTLHISKSYPLNKIVLLTGTPAPVRGAQLPLYALATLHVAMEKGVRYFDSYNYLLTEPANIYADSLHLSIKGQLNLATGLLNSGVFDSVQNVSANVLQAQKALTVHGRSYLNGIVNLDDDSTRGRQIIEGDFILSGNHIKSETFNKGVTILGDNVIKNQRWLAYSNDAPGISQRYGIGVASTGQNWLRLFSDGFSGDGVQFGQIDVSDGLTFNEFLHVNNLETKAFNDFIVTGSSTLVGTTIDNLSVTGNTAIGKQWNLFYDNATQVKFGIRMDGSSPYFTDIYTAWNASGNGVRLGWMDNDGSTFNSVLGAYKNGTVIIPGLATGGTAPATSGTIKNVVVDANGLLSFRDTVAAGGGSTPNWESVMTAGSAFSNPHTSAFAGNAWTITSTQSSTSAVNMNNTGNGTALSATSSGTGSAATFSNSSSGAGVTGTSSSGFGGNFTSTTGLGLRTKVTPSSTNTVVATFNGIRGSSGTMAIGGGNAWDMQLTDDAGNDITTARFSTVFTDATTASPDADFNILTITNGSLTNKLTIKPTSQVKLNGYGSNTFSGTVTAFLAVTSDGSVVETSTATGSIAVINDADYTVTGTESAIRYHNNITAARTVTLPDPSAATNREIWVKWNTINGGSSLTLTTTTGTALIYLDGTSSSASYNISTSFQSALLKSDGTSWYKIN